MLGCGVLAAVAADDLAGDRYTPKITAIPSGGKNIALLEGSIYEVTANYSKYVTADYMTGQDIFAPKSVSISWNCDEDVEYYTVKIATKKNMKKGLKTKTVKATASKYVAKKLKAKTTYWIRIRTYKVVNKEKIVSVWSKKVKVKTK